MLKTLHPYTMLLTPQPLKLFLLLLKKNTVKTLLGMYIHYKLKFDLVLRLFVKNLTEDIMLFQE